MYSIENTRGTTCGKAGPSMAVIVCCTWSGETIYGNKIAVDGPGGPVVVGDHLRHDRAIRKCPDYQGTLIIQLSLYDKVSFGTTTECVEYPGVLIFKCPD